MLDILKKLKKWIIASIIFLVSIGAFTFIQNEINKKDAIIQHSYEKIKALHIEFLSCKETMINYKNGLTKHNDIIQDTTLIYNRLLSEKTTEQDMKNIQDDINYRIQKLGNLQQQKNELTKCTQKIGSEIISIENYFQISKNNDIELLNTVDRLGNLFNELIILEKNRYIHYRKFKHKFYNDGLTKQTIEAYQEYANLVQDELDKNQEIYNLEVIVFEAMKDEINKIELELSRREKLNYLSKFFNLIKENFLHFN